MRYLVHRTLPRVYGEGGVRLIHKKECDDIECLDLDKATNIAIEEVKEGGALTAKVCEVLRGGMQKWLLTILREGNNIFMINGITGGKRLLLTVSVDM